MNTRICDSVFMCVGWRERERERADRSESGSVAQQDLRGEPTEIDTKHR